MRVIDKHHMRISHVHTKDVRRGVIASWTARSIFPRRCGARRLHGARRRLARLRRDRQRLAYHGYEGWFVVEAEQDPEAQAAARDGEERPQRTHARDGARRIRADEMNNINGKIAVVSGGTQGLARRSRISSRKPALRAS